MGSRFLNLHCQSVTLRDCAAMARVQVSIEPAVANKKVCRDIFRKLRETFGEAECGGKQGAYDGEKSYFTSGSLNFNSREFPVFLDDRKGPTFRPGNRAARPGDSPPGQSPPPGLQIPSAMLGICAVQLPSRLSPGANFVVEFAYSAVQEMLETRSSPSGGGPQQEGEISW